MHVKRTLTIVLGAGALAAWFAGAATSNRTLLDPIAIAPSAVDARGADLATEIAKLRERLRPSETPRSPGRNLFAFRAGAAVVAGTTAPPASRTAIVEAPAAVAPLPPLKLSGIAEDPAPDPAAPPIRIAFIAGDGQLFMVREGDPVTARYRVSKIAADAVELTDQSDRSVRRLLFR